MKIGRWFAGLVLATAMTSCGAVKLVPPEEMPEGSRARNLDFEQGTYAGGLPTGWFNPRGAGGGTPEEYRFEVVRDDKLSGKASLRIRFTAEHPTAYGGVMQCLRNPVPGRHRLVGYLKAQEVEGEGGSFWIRADSEERMSIAFQNMDGRRIRGSTDWERHSVEIQAPTSAAQLCFGVFLGGLGTLWADGLSLDG